MGEERLTHPAVSQLCLEQAVRGAGTDAQDASLIGLWIGELIWNR